MLLSTKGLLVTASLLVLNTISCDPDPNLCNLNQKHIALLNATIRSFETNERLGGKNVEQKPQSTAFEPEKVCWRKFYNLLTSLRELDRNDNNKCENETGVACVDSKFELVRRSLNEMIKSSEWTSRTALKKLKPSIDNLYKRLYEETLANQNIDDVLPLVKSKIREENYKEAAALLTRSTERLTLEEMENVAMKMNFFIKDSIKKSLLFASHLKASKISYAVAQSIFWAINDQKKQEDLETLHLYYVIESVMDEKNYGEQSVDFRRRLSFLIREVYEHKNKLVLKLLNDLENQSYDSLKNAEDYFAPEKLQKLLPELTTKKLESYFESSIDFMIQAASKLSSIGNQCIVMEAIYEKIQQLHDSSSIEAFQVFLFTRKTIDEEPNFKTEDILFKRKCVNVLNGLEDYKEVHLDLFYKMFDDQKSWRPLIGKIYSHPLSMKWMLPDLIENQYQGKPEKLRSLISFYKKLNSFEYSHIFLHSLIRQLRMFDEVNSFDAFRVFHHLKTVMTHPQYSQEGHIFQRKCETAKLLAPIWIEKILWNKTESCKIKNKSTGENLICSEQNARTENFNLIFTAGENEQQRSNIKWTIKIDYEDAQLLLQNRFQMNSYLHHGLGLPTAYGTRDGWKGWSGHSDEKWKIEGVGEEFIKLYYADGLYLTGTTRRCAGSNNCVDIKRGSRDSLQQWKFECD